MGTGLDPPPQEGWWGSLRLLLGLQQLGLLELGWQERCPQEGELGSQQQDCKGEQNVSVPCVKRGCREDVFKARGTSMSPLGQTGGTQGNHCLL